jgi:hypothetical protein
VVGLVLTRDRRITIHEPEGEIPMYRTNDHFDVQEQTAVLRLLASRSPAVSGDAARALGTTSSAARQLRIDRLVPGALDDAEAGWTLQERERLLMAMGTPPSDGGDLWSPPSLRV